MLEKDVEKLEKIGYELIFQAEFSCWQLQTRDKIKTSSQNTL
jgi:hypothetical protein